MAWVKPKTLAVVAALLAGAWAPMPKTPAPGPVPEVQAQAGFRVELEIQF